MELLKLIRNLSFVIACANIAISPLAEAAQAERSNVAVMKEFLKSSGLTKKKLTVIEFYHKIYPNLTNEDRAQFEPYIMMFRDQQMPSVDPVIFTDKNKIEQVRLNVSLDSKTYSLQTEGFDSTLTLKINGEEAARRQGELASQKVDQIAKAMGLKTHDSKLRHPAATTLVPSREVWKSWNPVQKGQYIVLMRMIADTASEILVKEQDRNTAAYDCEENEDLYASLMDVLLPQACAQSGGGNPTAKGKSCLLAGWKDAKYEVNGFCGGRPGAREQILKIMTERTGGRAAHCIANEGFPCNPMFYGLDKGGKAYCAEPDSGATRGTHVKNSNKKYNKATSSCGDKSKISKDGTEKDREQIAQIIRTNIELMNPDKKAGKIEVVGFDPKTGEYAIRAADDDYSMVQEYLAALEGEYLDAMKVCGDPVLEKGMTQVKFNSKNTSLFKARPDQEQACNELSKRFFRAKRFEAHPPSNPPKSPDDGASQITPPAEPGPGCVPKPIPQIPCQTAPPGDVGGGPKLETVPQLPDEPEKSGSLCRDEKGNFRDVCGAAAVVGLIAIAAKLDHNKTKRRKIEQKRRDPAPPPINPNQPGTGVGTTTPTPNPTPQPPPAKEGPATSIGNPTTPTAPVTKPGGR